MCWLDVVVMGVVCEFVFDFDDECYLCWVIQCGVVVVVGVWWCVYQLQGVFMGVCQFVQGGNVGFQQWVQGEVVGLQGQVVFYSCFQIIVCFGIF